MFYALSKIIGVLINPILWILTLLLIGLIVKKPGLKRKIYISAIGVILFFSNSFIFNEILLKWELKAVKNEQLQEKYDFGIVLSGMVWYDSETENVNFLQSSDRLWQTIRLYNEGKISKILISGGAAGFFEKDTIESALLKSFLIKINIPDSVIITEERSRNTYENAKYTAELLQSLPHDRLLLISSASHMRRALLCFEKAGLKCDAYPTDHYAGLGKNIYTNLFIPSTQTLFNWNVFIHEIFGMVSYKFSGYI